MNFGADASPYAAIAEQIRALTPRNLTGNMLDDVVTMIEYLRVEALKVHDANEKRAVELAEQAKDLERRSRELAVASRVAKAVINNKPRGLSWLRR